MEFVLICFFSLQLIQTQLQPAVAPQLQVVNFVYITGGRFVVVVGPWSCNPKCCREAVQLNCYYIFKAGSCSKLYMTWNLWFFSEKVRKLNEWHRRGSFVTVDVCVCFCCNSWTEMIASLVQFWVMATVSPIRCNNLMSCFLQWQLETCETLAVRLYNCLKSHKRTPIFVYRVPSINLNQYG